MSGNSSAVVLTTVKVTLVCLFLFESQRRTLKKPVRRGRGPSSRRCKEVTPWCSRVGRECGVEDEGELDM